MLQARGLVPVSARLVAQIRALLAQCFETAAIGAMLQQHHAGSANFTRELRALAALALWADGMQA